MLVSYHALYMYHCNHVHSLRLACVYRACHYSTKSRGCGQALAAATCEVEASTAQPKQIDELLELELHREQSEHSSGHEAVATMAQPNITQ